MNLFNPKFICSVFFVSLFLSGFSQIKIEAGDPPNNSDIPEFFNSKLSDIQKVIENVKVGEVKTIANSPGD